MARYIPGNVPTNPAQLADFVRTELDKIAAALDSPNESMALTTLYAVPNKFRDGTIVKADGTTWNPGAGSGVYVYRDAAWHLLG
jgi:hypothetical protein